ncbi:hypothetical protein, partial [Plasmodium yoelii yoelii]
NFVNINKSKYNIPLLILLYYYSILILNCY